MIDPQLPEDQAGFRHGRCTTHQVVKLTNDIEDSFTNIWANRSFVLTTSDGQHLHLRRLRNGLPQGSCLSPLLFNFYISDQPKSKSLQYDYADDLALFYSHQRWRTIEETLTADVEHVPEYIKL